MIPVFRSGLRDFVTVLSCLAVIWPLVQSVSEVPPGKGALTVLHKLLPKSRELGGKGGPGQFNARMGGANRVRREEKEGGESWGKGFYIQHASETTSLLCHRWHLPLHLRYYYWQALLAVNMGKSHQAAKTLK
jgi:hypothetical protein